MSQTKPTANPKVIKGMAKDGAIPRGSLSIPMPAGAKTPPPAPNAGKAGADPRK
jgi:hypothetical protein